MALGRREKKVNIMSIQREADVFLTRFSCGVAGLVNVEALVG